MCLTSLQTERKHTCTDKRPWARRGVGARATVGGRSFRLSTLSLKLTRYVTKLLRCDTTKRILFHEARRRRPRAREPRALCASRDAGSWRRPGTEEREPQDQQEESRRKYEVIKCD